MKCKVCKAVYNTADDHRCFMTPLELRSKRKKKKQKNQRVETGEGQMANEDMEVVDETHQNEPEPSPEESSNIDLSSEEEFCYLTYDFETISEFK